MMGWQERRRIDEPKGGNNRIFPESYQLLSLSHRTGDNNSGMAPLSITNSSHAMTVFCSKNISALLVTH